MIILRMILNSGLIFHSLKLNIITSSTLNYNSNRQVSHVCCVPFCFADFTSPFASLSSLAHLTGVNHAGLQAYQTG
jgi:hypothetical protein